MDIGTASALNLYNFQTTAKSSGQPAAILQALTSVYNGAMAAAGSDPASQLLMSAGMAPVADAMTKLGASTDGTKSVPLESLQSYLTYGGLNTTTASMLFSSSTADSGASNANQGFDAALTAGATMALAAYQASINFPATQPAAASNPVNLLG